jgi:hypothetical protein
LVAVHEQGNDAAESSRQARAKRRLKGGKFDYYFHLHQLSGGIPLFRPARAA